MITRSFLFLLAMLTGLSAAQAANASHDAPTSIGASVEMPVAELGNVAAGHHWQALAEIFWEQPRRPKYSNQIEIIGEGHLALLPQRTFRGERARE